MRNIIVFGNVPLATWVVKQLNNNANFNLVGVVCDEYSEDAFINHGMEEKSLYSYCVTNGIEIIDFVTAKDLALQKPILGISVRYHRLFKKNYYESFTPGIINLHGGELPRYRGANIANYAVYEDAKRVGGTLHFISEGIDEGNVVERVLLPIENKPTAFEFFSLTLEALQQAFTYFLNREDVIDSNQKIISTPQIEFVKNGETDKLYFKKEIEEKRIIDFNTVKDWDELFRFARAYTFPGHKGLLIKNGEEYIEVKAVKNDTKNIK